MTQDSLGVAVIGVGMVGRAHAAGYRTAGSLFDITGRPDARLVAIADAYEPFAVDAAKRFGYERSETSWQAIVEAPDIDVVSVAVANSMHREVVEALLAAGKHVLCEKPLAPSVEDAKAMVRAAEAATTHAGVGFTFRRAPGSTRSANRSWPERSAMCATSTATTGATTPRTPTARSAGATAAARAAARWPTSAAT